MPNNIKPFEELTLADDFMFYQVAADKVEAAKNLLRIGLGTHEQIAQVQDLPLKKVQELAEEIAAENENK